MPLAQEHPHRPTVDGHHWHHWPRTQGMPPWCSDLVSMAVVKIAERVLARLAPQPVSMALAKKSAITAPCLVPEAGR